MKVPPVNQLLHSSVCFSFGLAPVSSVSFSSLSLLSHFIPPSSQGHMIRNKTDVKHVACSSAVSSSFPLSPVILYHHCQYFVDSCKTQGSLSSLPLSFPPSPHSIKVYTNHLPTFTKVMTSFHFSIIHLFPLIHSSSLFLASSSSSDTSNNMSTVRNVFLTYLVQIRCTQEMSTI